MIVTPCGLVLAERAGVVVGLTNCCGAIGMPGKGALAYCSWCDRWVREIYTLAALPGTESWAKDILLMLDKGPECPERMVCLDLVTNHFAGSVDSEHLRRVGSLT